ncbi:MAG: four helix bundle protein [Bacteroidota bacterium]
MGKIDRFEDIESWKKARELSKSIYSITNNALFSNDPSLKDQIRRAVVSISSNIAEGFEQGGTQEVIQFLFIAKGSCGEVRSQIYLALDCEYVSENEFQNIKGKAEEVSKLIQGFINYLKETELKGAKYSESEVDYTSFKLTNENKEII